jgi:phosphoglycerate kinase
MSLKPAAERLRMLLDQRLGASQNVGFSPDCAGEEAKELVSKLGSSHVLLLENLRFHAEEEANDPAFAKELASLADYYVNDAFGSAHRAHASTEGITKFVEKSAAGLLMEKELQYLGKALQSPQRPFVAILGGAKVSDKIGVIQNLLGKVDALLIGGAMAYTFFKASGRQVGKSLVEDDKLDLAKQLLEQAKSQKIKLLLPVDDVIAPKIESGVNTSTLTASQAIPADQMGLDIGPQTAKLYGDEIARAKTIVWNGPMGVFETHPFDAGTIAVAKAVAENTDATSIVGGGDSVAAVHAAGVSKKITHISTGGGASLEFLEGQKLPGVEALTER